MSKQDARHYHTYIYPTRYIDLTRQQPSCTIPSYSSYLLTYCTSYLPTLTARKVLPQKAVVLRFFFLFFRTKYLSKKKSPPGESSFFLSFRSAFSDAACFPSVFNYFCTFRTIA